MTVEEKDLYTELVNQFIENVCGMVAQHCVNEIFRSRDIGKFMKKERRRKSHWPKLKRYRTGGGYTVSEERIDLWNGKYTVIMTDNGRSFRALRHGEEWRDLRGDNLVLAMFDKIHELVNQFIKNVCDDGGEGTL